MTPSTLDGRSIRAGGPDDVETITRTIGMAFANDPVWGPAMGGPSTTSEEKASIWRMFIAGAVRYPWSRVVDNGAAVSVWIPPGGTEMEPAEEQHLRRVVAGLLGPARTADYFDLVERFEANHRADVPHAYLSLLATHPDHRGHGLGMALLADDLRRLDELHLPAWLESTNPANDLRYASVGFRVVGEFRTIDEERPITTMWREAR